MTRRRGTLGTIRPYKGRRFIATFCHRYQQHRKICRTREEATTWLAATRAAVEQSAAPLTTADMLAAGIAKAHLPPGIGLGEVVAFWIKHHAQDGIAIAQAVERFLFDKSKAGLRPGSMRNLRWHCGRLVRVLGAMPLRAAMQADIAHALNQLNPNPGSARNDTRRVWHTFWAWSVSAGLADTNPVASITTTRADEALPGIYTPEQAAALLRAAATGARTMREMLPFLALGFFAGLRMCEISRLDLEDIDTEAGHIHIRGHVAKMRTRRYVSINETLRAWLPHFSKRRGNILRVQERARIIRLVRLREEARVPSIHNAMRHSFASYHLAMHQDASKTAFELGHTKPDLLYRHYRNLVTKTQAQHYWSLTPTLVLHTIHPHPNPQPTQPAPQQQLEETLVHTLPR